MAVLQIGIACREDALGDLSSFVLLLEVPQLLDGLQLLSWVALFVTGVLGDGVELAHHRLVKHLATVVDDVLLDLVAVVANRIRLPVNLPLQLATFDLDLHIIKVASNI